MRPSLLAGTALRPRAAIRARAGHVVALAQVASCLAAGAAWASPVTVSFGNYSNLGSGVGTTQTLTNIDPSQEFEMTVLQGNYEITFPPYNELDLKDQSGAGYTRSVQFTLKDGARFDFTSVTVNDGSGSAAFSSDNGGNSSVSPARGTTTFSGPQWDGITELTITFMQRYGEFKIPALTFDDNRTVPVPEPASLALLGGGLIGLGLVRRRRKAA